MSKNASKNTTVEVIVPPGCLRDQVKITGSGPIDTSPIEKAERALDQLSVAFDSWLVEEVTSLTKARDAVHTQGLSPETRKELHRTAHDLKGQGQTYGYPLITHVCSTLCKLLETAIHPDLIPVDLIDHHVNAVRNIMKMKVKTTDHPKSLAVVNRLYDVVMEFSDREDEIRKQMSSQSEQKST
jgi:chemotaxis protein histidine kinase CheA